MRTPLRDSRRQGAIRCRAVVGRCALVEVGPWCNPDHVLDLGARHVEVGRDLGEAIAGLEAVDQILDPRAAVDDHRLVAGLGRVDRDLGLGLGG